METCFCGCSSSTLLRDEIRGGKRRDILRCDRCGAVRKGTDDIEEHHRVQKEGEQVGELDLDPLSKAYVERNMVDVDRRVRAVTDYLDGDERLLDFGTGMGHFLDAVEDEVNSVVGSELNARRIEFVRRELGHEVLRGTDRLLEEYGPNSFEVVTMFHVLEHLPGPVEQLAKIEELLTDDGLLIVEVPNHNDWLLSASDAYADFYYQDAHAYYFDPRTLHLALVLGGFGSEIEGVQRYSYRNAKHWLFVGEPEIDAPSRYDGTWSDPRDKLYSTVLGAVDRSDTLWAVAEPT
jgi:2-polyprenyl-3-methyl-5-hydroxy-6-metoxy-1,4-benzoquinol methylase